MLPSTNPNIKVEQRDDILECMEIKGVRVNCFAGAVKTNNPEHPYRNFKLFLKFLER